MKLTELEVAELRIQVGYLKKHIDWEFRTGRWPSFDYEPHFLSNMLNILKVDSSDYHLKKQDKRGAWR